MKNDGGYAFPVDDTASAIQHGCEPHVSYGITMRDYFAAMALNGMMEGVESPSCEYIAEQCYKVADAMLAERSKQ